ncbi:hypothetical protein DFS33DRAFT_1097100 [Desarmillaria ectypa]|nr:hypothetical protein DFS33DRAFT_1097100 [Desarmillaria ectypa]
MLYYLASLSFSFRFPPAFPIILTVIPNTSLCFISFWLPRVSIMSNDICAISFSPQFHSHLCYPCLSVYIFHC